MRVDHSGILVWAFLGLCGGIVVMQVVPAVILFVESIKGLVSNGDVIKHGLLEKGRNT